jgi:predicted transcriptional regulator YdeE
MNKKVQLNPFRIIGIATRTTNANGKAMTDLGNLWGKFYGENIASKIPEKISDVVYAVYTDYETDHTGSYTAIIGCRVDALAQVPDGMTEKEIAGGSFIQFTGKGEMPGAVVNCWKEIWDNDKTLHRAYTADFEAYGERSEDPDAVVEVYIATKE